MMSQKDELSPHQQRREFARAFDTVQHYLEIGNFIGAYVIAFSILEDRVAAMFAACISNDVDKAGKPGKHAYLKLSKKINQLAHQGVITTVEQQHWLSIAKERNHKLHNAMWNLDEFQSSDVEKVVAAARQAINARKRQRRLRVQVE